MKGLLSVCLLVLLHIQAYAQFQVYGKVRDISGVPLAGATIWDSISNKGTSTNSDGTFLLVVPQPKVMLVVSFIGYHPYQQTFTIEKVKKLEIILEPTEIQLSEVEIHAENIEELLSQTQMGKVQLSAREAQLIPALFGEVDILKTLQLKPGVQSGNEGTTGLYVRGGSPDQNLFLLDGATVYNPSHLFGLFSIFNNDAIENVTLYKGDFPSQFGGRLASVVDVKMRNGSPTDFKGNGGIGLIASRLTIDVPIIPQKLTAIFSGRRTYFDIFTRELNRRNEKNPNYDPIPDYFFYDGNAKISYQVASKHSISFSGYGGRDIFTFKRNRITTNFSWGNLVGILTWKYLISPKLTINTSTAFTKYNYIISSKLGNIFNISLESRISDRAFLQEWIYVHNNRHSFVWGVNHTYHQFIIGRFDGGSPSNNIKLEAGEFIGAHQTALYISHEYTYQNFQLRIGLRGVRFSARNQPYYGTEPRFSISYRLTPRLSFKASFAHVHQFLHLASNSAATLPTDVWYPSTRIVRPQLSQQVAAGFSISLWKDKLFFSQESYYKWLWNQVDFKDGARLYINQNLENEFVFGKGWCYGTEFYLEKRVKKTTGWLGYTIAYTWRQFENINYGKPFRPRYDRRHDFSAVLLHRFNWKWHFSLTWIYGTGSLTTLPPARYTGQDIYGTNGGIVPMILERNNFRMAPYHRADIALIMNFRPRKHYRSSLNFSIYNLYNRRNPFYIYLDTQETVPNVITGIEAKQVSLFPAIPSITYNFEF
ncbi:MAG: TonB-dependent receptor [Cytophagales bacterium]|nr:TonB-dependent receptor [Cytophagales bacterium]MDW8384511.1 TonB-dependent receptor [Flammeovirgaceae bacterium]